MAKETMDDAHKAKKNEFYTMYEDIQTEINAYLEYDPNVFKNKTVLLPCDDPEWSNFTKFFVVNFQMLGLKKLISTSYALESKNNKYADYQFTLEDYLTDYEKNAPQFDPNITTLRGKIFTLEKDVNNDGIIDIDDLQWSYLEGDGDFSSEEVTKLRDESDIIITNPPFALFRKFMAWVMEGNKKFIVLSNQNAITYKEFFPLLKNNLVWAGTGFNMSLVYKTPYVNDNEANRKFVKSKGFDPDEGYLKVPGVCWFTNVEHGRRHQPFIAITMGENIKYSKVEDLKTYGYQKYDNYDAIEIPNYKVIPSDYKGVMGVPITFLDKYCPDQFEILGLAMGKTWDSINDVKVTRIYNNAIQHSKKNDKTSSGSKVNTGAALVYQEPHDTTYYTADEVDGYIDRLYSRLLLKYTDEWIKNHPEDFD